MNEEDDSHVGFGLDDHIHQVIGLLERELTCEPRRALPPLGWLCAVVDALGDVADSGRRFAEAQIAHVPQNEPDDAWLESVTRLARVALGAVDAHSLHHDPGDHGEAEVMLCLAFWEIKDQVCERGRHTGDPMIWTARLSEQVGAYVSTLLSCPDAAPSEVGGRPVIALQHSGPAALVVCALAMLAASVALRDAA